MRRSLLNTVFILILIGAQGVLWAGKGGLTDMRHMKQALLKKQQENEQLREKNEALAAEVQDLKGGMEAIEEIARHDLIMTREGETYFQILDYDPE